MAIELTGRWRPWTGIVVLMFANFECAAGHGQCIGNSMWSSIRSKTIPYAWDIPSKIDPEKKGQWWSSGDMASATENVEDVASRIDKEALEAQKMLQLAAKQRMNTDARRAIFCIIMSGEDYIDAFEKLLRLELPGKQVGYLLFFREREFLFIFELLI